MGSPVDFAAIARQFGGSSALSSHEPTPQPAPPSPDYGALVQQFGGRTLIQQPPKAPNVSLPPGSEMDDPLTMAVGFARGLLGGEQSPGVTPSGFGALLGAALPLTKGVKALKNAVSAEKAAQDAIIAYHGSPHDFDKFNLSKIGTGEGAQAYGHGLYFADVPQVAETYKGVQGRASVDPAANIASKVMQAGQDPAHRLKSIFPSMSDEEIGAAIARAQNAPEGKMYQVRINASPDEFLDWDKPLSQQPEVAKRLGMSTRTKDQITADFEKVVAEGEARSGRAGGWAQHPDLNSRWDALQAEFDKVAPNITGADYYRGTTPDNFLHSVLSGGNSSPETSQELLAKGIQGIKYLDGASRSAGEGSRNYVVFDDSLIDILKKYGVLLPAIGLLKKAADRSGGVLPSGLVHSTIDAAKKK